MHDYSERYHLKPAAAWLRGHAVKTGTPEIDSELLEMPLEVLTDGELAAIVEIGERTGLKLYPFKTGKSELPRVRQVLGSLHGIEFENLLDVGSGRGVFLLPFMEESYKCKKVRIELPRQFEYASDSNNEELTCGYTAVYIYDYGSAADFRQFGIDQDTDIMDAAVSIQSKMGETGEIIKLDSNKAYYTFVTDDYFLLELIYDYGPGFANVEFLGASSMKDILFDYFLDWASTVN